MEMSRKEKIIRWILLIVCCIAYYFNEPKPGHIQMIGPLAIAAVATAIGTGSKIWASAKQNKLAKELAGTPRPDMPIPESALKALESAKYLTNIGGLPGEKEYEGMIKENTAEMYERAANLSQTPSQALGVAQKLAAKENDQLRELKIKGAEFQANAVRNLMGQENVIAGYEQQQFQVNEMDPYLQAMAASSALRGASMQNLHSGLSDISKIGTTYAMMQGLDGSGTGGAGSGTSGFDYDKYIKYKMATEGLTGETYDPTRHGFLG